jgi:hypothetical protein
MENKPVAMYQSPLNVVSSDDSNHTNSSGGVQSAKTACAGAGGD